MTQRIAFDFPPNYDELRLAFNLDNRRDVIFSYGQTIFNPYRVPIAPELLAHEDVHGQRQVREGVEDWWKRYVDDSRFRLHEETLAHVAEYQWRLSHGNRNERRAALNQTAERLASPLYGRMISKKDARTLISREAIIKVLQGAPLGVPL